MVSLGTGIGGGIIINNKIYEGMGSAGEIGHFSLDMNGRECPCGMKGCFEQYASAAALVSSAESAAVQNTESVLHKIYSDNGNKLADGCGVAEAVLDEYIKYLAVGLSGIVNIFDPDMIVLSGGITNVGDMLLTPLKSAMNSDTEITVSKLKGDAGTIGAALLIV